MEGRYPYAEFREEEKLEGCSDVLYSKVIVDDSYKMRDVLSEGYDNLLD